MKHVMPEYHERLRESGAIEACLREAQERFPGEELSYCGFEDNWEDCVSGFDAGDEFKVLLQFNIGADTHGIMRSVTLH